MDSKAFNMLQQATGYVAELEKKLNDVCFGYQNGVVCWGMVEDLARALRHAVNTRIELRLVIAASTAKDKLP